MCQNIIQKEDTWFNGLGDLMWNYPVVINACFKQEAMIIFGCINK